MVEKRARTTNGHARVYTKADWTDFAHTGPGTLAGRYMRLFWQPVSRAMDLPVGRAKPIRIMSEDFTLYRGEGGAPHLLAFRCAHRGTQLSTGWVEGDNLRCFYHGWMYDGMGQCVEQPAEPEPFCGKIKIRSYPVEEYLGLIFAYLGEGEAPPLPRYPDFEVEGVLDVNCGTLPCNYFQTLENDPVHAAFVHRPARLPKGVFGAHPKVSAVETEWGLTEFRLWPNDEFRDSQHGMPNIRHNMKMGGGYNESDRFGWLDSLYWRLPIDDEHQIQFTVDLAHVTGEDAGRYRERRATRREPVVPAAVLGQEVLAGRMQVDDINDPQYRTSRINAQDYVAQVGQGIIADRAHERLGRTDVSVILFRKLWARELRALAEGRPLTQWRRPEHLRASNSSHANASNALRDRAVDPVS